MVLKEEIALLGKKNKLLILTLCVMAIINDFGNLLREVWWGLQEIISELS